MDPDLHAPEWIGRRIRVIVDRPLGSAHPQHPDLVYELNYGNVPGTLAPDGDPLDVYIIDAGEPLETATAEVIAVLRRRDDIEDKLVAQIGHGRWPADEILMRTRFQERWFDTYIDLGDGPGRVDP